MNQKFKLAAIAGLLAAIVAASALLYDFLSARYAAPEPMQSVSQKTAGDERGQEAKKIKAPDFSVLDKDGNAARLSDFAGKPVVLNFWASWCPPCRSEMPEFDRVSREMDGVVFLMVNMTDGARETEEKAKAYIAEQGFSLPVYFDARQEAAYAYGITSLPTTCFIDRDGYFVKGIRGMLSEAALRANIALIYQ